MSLVQEAERVLFRTPEDVKRGVLDEGESVRAWSPYDIADITKILAADGSVELWRDNDGGCIEVEIRPVGTSPEGETP